MAILLGWVSLCPRSALELFFSYLIANELSHFSPYANATQTLKLILSILKIELLAYQYTHFSQYSKDLQYYK